MQGVVWALTLSHAIGGQMDNEGRQYMEDGLLFAERIVLGLIFAISSISKIHSFSTLVDEIMDYRIVSRGTANLFSPCLPAAELAISASLLTGILLPVGSLGAGALLLVFSVAIVVNLRRGRRFSCHCFGKTRTLIGPSTVARNAALFVLACAVAVQSFPAFSLVKVREQWQTDLQLLRGMETGSVILGTMAMIVCFIALLSESDVVIPYLSGKQGKNGRVL